MPRLIDADALLEDVRCDNAIVAHLGGVELMQNIINDQPTIEASPQWIPVTERLPEIVKTTKAHRNVYRRTDRVLCACLQTNGKRMVKEGYAEFFNDYPEPNWKIPGTIHSVTHWMPLPELPGDGGAEND